MESAQGIGSHLALMVLGVLLLVHSSSAYGNADLTILGAAYGPRDVTYTVQGEVSQGTLNIQASNSLFGDPWKGVVKSLVVVYQHEGYEPATVIVQEGQSLSISSKAAVSLPPSFNCNSYPLSIAGAAYGLGEVTGITRSYVSNGHLNVVASNSVFRDTWKGTKKTLVVVYQQRNGAYMTEFAREGERLQI